VPCYVDKPTNNEPHLTKKRVALVEQAIHNPSKMSGCRYAARRGFLPATMRYLNVMTVIWRFLAKSGV
jgi:hypothetical protein